MEAGAAIVESETCSGRDDAAAKGVCYAVDQRAGVALLVCHAEIDGVAGFVDAIWISRGRYHGRSHRIEKLGSLSKVWS